MVLCLLPAPCPTSSHGVHKEGLLHQLPVQPTVHGGVLPWGWAGRAPKGDVQGSADLHGGGFFCEGGAVWGVLRVESHSGGRASNGGELLVGAAGWEVGLGLSVGQEVAMGLWGGSCQWGSGAGAACGAVMWQLVCLQGWAGAGGAAGHVRDDDAGR